MNDIDSDIPKHRKKKGSSVSKSRVKSKHKHEYVECLLVENNHPNRATYCKICGKIGDIHFLEFEEKTKFVYRVLQDNEVFERYKDLEKIEVENLWQQYVPINSKGGDQA